MQLPYSWCEYLKTPISGFPELVNVDKLKTILHKRQLEDKDYKWVYSNYGFTLLGYAIGVTHGKGYWSAMDDFISNELGLKNSYTGTISGKNLQGFNKRNKNRGNYIYAKSPSIPGGEGDISATAEDLLSYAQMNMHEEKSYFKLCHTKHAAANSILASTLMKPSKADKIDMGLGWMIYRNNSNIMWHLGGSGVFTSYLAFDKSMKIAVVVLSNYVVDVGKIGVSALEYLQKQIII